MVMRNISGFHSYLDTSLKLAKERVDEFQDHLEDNELISGDLDDELMEALIVISQQGFISELKLRDSYWNVMTYLVERSNVIVANMGAHVGSMLSVRLTKKLELIAQISNYLISNCSP